MINRTEVRRASSRTANAIHLEDDLCRFREMAIELGSSAAEIVPVSLVVVQERVWMKCLVPRCPMAGRTPHCPPNTPQPEFMRKVFSQYQKALVFRRDLKPVADYTRISETQDAPTGGHRRRPFHKQTWEILGQLESHIQSKGYDLAMGFGGGCCNSNLCEMAPCAVSQDQACRHPLRARPSMEAVGIDVFDLASKLGWDAYMIRRVEPNPEEIPSGISVGLILVY